MPRTDLRKKVVLLTGASSGIGAALATELAKRGSRLVLAARREEELKKKVEEIRAFGGEAIAVRCDVTRDGDVEKAAENALEAFGQLDIAIANAGFGVAGPLDHLTLDDYRRQFETNVFGVLRTIYGTLPELKKNGGHLVLVGSVAGHIALPGGSPYSMSKFCMTALGKAIEVELRQAGVAVTVVSPGFVDSDIRRVDNRGELHRDVSDPIPKWLRVPAPTAAREIARAIECQASERIITFHGKVFVFVHRYFEWVLRFAMSLGLRARREPERTLGS